MENLQTLRETYAEVRHTLTDKVIPFWTERSHDKEYGGYFIAFDKDGEFYGDSDKLIITQTRMLWGFSHLSRYVKEDLRVKMLELAKQGYEFFVDKFWDKTYGGFYWKCNRRGEPLDKSKLVYGQSFAIYALSEYYLATGEKEALDYAEKTFALLQLYAADTLNGGYYENIEEDFTLSEGGAYAGDRKSLDIHLHLLEAFTTLYEANPKEVYARKLREIIGVILTYMVDCDAGYGYNQFDVAFHRIPAIAIKRTWNDERESNESIATPVDTTSYGHNVELVWLLHRALSILDENNEEYDSVMKKILNHSLKYGYDYEYGGVFRDGVADKEVLVTDKEWWQNFESLVGYLDGYTTFCEEKYREAFLLTWNFVKTKFMNMEVGESRQLLDRQGNPLVENMGNQWKGIYHTGRALAECIDRFERLFAQN